MRTAFERFGTEAELCEAFLERVAAAGLEAHPEVEGWDLVVVVPAARSAWNVELQIGVEAKLRANLDVVAQAAGRMRRRRRPRAAAVLVPRVPMALHEVCRELRLAVWTPASWLDGYVDYVPLWPDADCEPLELPRFEVPHLRAGQPAPRPLTKWREAAIRLCLRLRARGYVTSRDFRELGVSKRLWTRAGGWLVRDGYDGRVSRYRLRPGASGLPDEGWDAVVEQIRREEAA